MHLAGFVAGIPDCHHLQQKILSGRPGATSRGATSPAQSGRSPAPILLSVESGQQAAHAGEPGARPHGRAEAAGSRLAAGAVTRLNMDVEAYLRRIGYDGPRLPSADTLRTLHRQHLFTVPFENLDIPLGTRICLDSDLLYRKVVTRSRGGYCYELNGLFCELLNALGFDVCMLSAQVRSADGSFGPDFDHMLLRVTLDEPWVADVGFGDSFVDPLPLLAGASHQGTRKGCLVLSKRMAFGNCSETTMTERPRSIDLPRFRVTSPISST